MTGARPGGVRPASAVEAQPSGPPADTGTGAGPLSVIRPREPAGDAGGPPAAIAAKPQALPLISADGLTVAQRKGNSCASCRKKFPRPSVAAGITTAGEVLMTCPECVIVLAGDVLPVSGRVPRQGP
jgi:hypothetical protein